jgi:putative CocE/NonD family hydrolase
MKDGARLATDVYVPAGQGPFPPILARTPYNKDGMAALATDAVLRGYAAVIQDTRGRFASEGEALPFAGDGWHPYADGHETLEWIARQSWSNAKIGTTGGSALGITQILEAAAGSPFILAQTIYVGAPNPYHDFVFTGGVFRKSMIEDWLRLTNHSPRSLAYYSSGVYDRFWKSKNAGLRYDKVNTPAIHVGGWFDIFAQGTLDTFMGYQYRGGPKARGHQKLIMGPWTHGIFTEKAGDLTFKEGAAPPGGIADAWRWNDAWLKGAKNGIRELPAVAYYTMGDTSDPTAPGNVWRTASRWPPFETYTTALFLQADGALTRSRPGGPTASLGYEYDPEKPAPTVGGVQLVLPSGPRDQKPLDARTDVLQFATEPLGEPLEVTGRVRARLYVSSDAPDTDFFVKLCDQYPDGRVFNICEGQIRTRFREGFSKEKLLKPGEIAPVDVDLWSTSIVFNRGHRIKVLVTSSSSPGYDPNPNTGESFRASARKRPARNTVWMDARRPSHILLPVRR